MADQYGEREPFKKSSGEKLEVVGNVYENPNLFEFEKTPEALEMVQELLKATEGLALDAGTYRVYGMPVSIILHEADSLEESEKRKYWHIAYPKKPHP